MRSVRRAGSADDDDVDEEDVRGGDVKSVF